MRKGLYQVLKSKTYYDKMREFERTPFWFVLDALLKALLDEARHRQDAAEEKDVYRNQGAIKELKNMIKNIQLSGEEYGYTESYQA